ncbi:MAG: hypothetical protein KDK70_04690 [Myxococcales bacterium]|nr:hypothetical protein [Myxococcales bacterium]
MIDTPVRDRLEQQLAFDLIEPESPEASIWAQVAAGTLSPKEAVARALELDPAQDPALLAQYAELFAPPSARQRKRELALTLEERFPTRTRSRRSTPLLVAGGAVALAAALALLLRRTEPPEPLPSYRTTWTWWHSDAGPADAAIPATATATECVGRVHQALDLEVELHPATAVTRTLEVAGWARSDDDRVVELRLTPTISEQGTVFIRQPVRELGLHEGRWAVTFVVGPAGTLPREPPLDPSLDPTLDRSLDPSAPTRPDLAILRDFVCVVQE